MGFMSFLQSVFMDENITVVATAEQVMWFITKTPLIMHSSWNKIQELWKKLENVVVSGEMIPK